MGIEGITYAGNHGLEILHPDGSKFVHPMPVECEVEVSKLLQALQDSVSTGSVAFRDVEELNKKFLGLSR